MEMSGNFEWTQIWCQQRQNTICFGHKFAVTLLTTQCGTNMPLINGLHL